MNGPPAYISVKDQPSGSVAGYVFLNPVVVDMYDSADNLCTTYSVSIANISLYDPTKRSPSTFSLFGTLSANFSSGATSFFDIYLTTSGTFYFYFITQVAGYSQPFECFSSAFYILPGNAKMLLLLQSPVNPDNSFATYFAFSIWFR